MRWLVTGAILVVSVVSVGVLGLRMLDRQSAYTVDSAVEAFRATGGTGTTVGSVNPGNSAASGDAPPTITEPEVRDHSGTDETAERAEPENDDVGAGTAPETAAVGDGGLAFSTAPPAGVYRYRTDGAEEVDLLGGSRHEYPDETPITVVSTPCGYRTRWQPLDGRWEERELCTDSPGLRLLSFTGHREFFTSSYESSAVCGPDAFYAVADPARPSWTAECTGSSGSEYRYDGRFVEELLFDVGGTSVPAVTVSLVVRVGAERGTSYTEAKAILDRKTGLPLRVTSRTDSTINSSVGSGSYTETYDIELLSLEPVT